MKSRLVFQAALFLNMGNRSQRKKDVTVRQLQFEHAETLYGCGELSHDVVRADKLRMVLERLFAINAGGVPILVEGRRDREALRDLGLDGEILTLHGRGGFYEFAEGIHAVHDSVVLLLDWDEKGEMLQSQIGTLLNGLWEGYAPMREALKNLCQKDIRDVQGIPALLQRLTGTRVIVGTNREEGGSA